MNPSKPQSSANPLPHVLVTLGAVGLYPPATEGVGEGTGAQMGAPGGAPLLAPGKPLALLTFLALSPGRSASREFLLDLLWADMDGDRARHALRQTIWQVRQLLGESALDGREEIRLALPLESDRDHFLAAVEAGDLAQAVTRYTGPFLPAFAAPGGAEFEQWADRERDRLRALFTRAADTLARRRLARGNPRDAVKLARRVREAEPLHEGGWRLLIEALLAANDRVQALVEADALEELLRQEGRELEPATRTALRAARQSSDPGSVADPTATLVAELVGREREFSSLLQGWDQARLGPAVHILVTAPAGLGKTRLLQDVRARLRTLGARIVLVRANPGERDLACSLAADLAGALGELPGASAIPPAAAATLVALNPALSTRFTVATAQGGGGDQVIQRTLAIAELVNAVAFESPVAILVDDLHWADPSSLQILRGVQARIAGARVLLVTTTRPNRGLTRESAETTTLPLAPLAMAEVAAMLTSIAQPPDGPVGELLISTLWRASGGSPLHVLDAIQHAMDNGHLALDGTSWQVLDIDALADELARGGSIGGRLRSLDRPGSFLMTLLATAGTPCSTALLSRAAAREGVAVAGTLADLERRGFITQVRGDWEPAHDEIAAAMLDITDLPTQRAAARALAESLTNAGHCDDLTLRRALQLLIAAGATDRIGPVLVAQVPGIARARSGVSRERRVAEWLGRPMNDPLVATVAADLPQARDWARGLGWAAGVTVVVAAAILALPGAAGEEGSRGASLLLLTSSTEGRTEVRQATIRPVRWTAQRPITFGAPVLTLPPSVSVRSGGRLAVSRNGWALYHSPAVDNRRTNEIARTDHSGTRFLAEAERDDTFPSPAPDRRWIVFSTSRWSPRGDDDLDLALMDSTGGRLRQLTRGPAVDHFPTWDPTGTRIAFLRKYREIRPAELCVVTPEGTLLRCHPLLDIEPNEIAGWLNLTTVVVTGGTTERDLTIRLDLVTGQSRSLLTGQTPYLRLSPDAHWTVCRCDLLESEQPGWWLFPTLDPGSARRLEVPEGHVPLVATWNDISGLPAHWIDTLHLRDLPYSLPRASSHRPRVEGRTPHGALVPVPRESLRWWSSDPSIVAVDSASGLLTPLVEGVTTIHVSAGGWREASARIVVKGGAHTVLMTEGWDQLSDATWRGYGDPRPRLARGPGGRDGLVPNGDGSFPTGLYSRAVWPAHEGLGFEALVSTPVNRTTWQTLGAALATTAFDAGLGEWDHRTGAAPASEQREGMGCGIGYPAHEGAAWVEHAGVAASRQFRQLGLEPSKRTGGWWRMRIQVFRDGTCGLAIDGVPRWRSTARVDLTHPLRLWLTGHAVGTTPMFGALEVWSGIRGDVDWKVLDSLPR